MIIAMDREEIVEKFQLAIGKRVDRIEVPYNFAMRIVFDDGTSVEIQSTHDVIGDYFEVERG
jgi:hypothetical protein